jgi:predicted RNase H-like HicB family nuclease
MADRQYAVVLYRDVDGGFWTDVPELPGTGSQGETMDEALENTREAVVLMIEYLRETGQTVPSGDPIIAKITVAA